MEEQLKIQIERYEKLRSSMASFEQTLEEKEAEIAAKAAALRCLNVSNKFRQVSEDCRSAHLDVVRQIGP